MRTAAGGNAYNQRAVLAMYETRELEAVYNYFRSLGVTSPFTIAKENVNQLFEQVRQRQKGLPPPALGRGSHKPTTSWKLPDLMRTVETRFLHLHGEALQTASNQAFLSPPGCHI